MSKQIPVLLVEDQENDVLLMHYAFEKARIPHPLLHVRDGEEAIQYLSGQGRFTDRELYPLPCAIVTDIKMPRVNGFELLAWLQQQEQLREVPAIAISSSAHQHDRDHALRLGAQAYYTKPGQLSGLLGFVRELEAKWLAEHCGA